LERLSEEADLIIKYSMASNSWKTYKTALEAFIQFRLIYKFGNIWPADISVRTSNFEGLFDGDLPTFYIQ
jgi:hypothetical protein